jgi:predicted acetyltransferase
VPSSVYWLLSENGYLLGDIRIRHRLTPAWEDLGGHIDYGVRPSQRRKGYATRMLAMALEKARAMGLKRVLITCDPANVGSVRTIQRNGGKLLSESIAKNGRLTSRYWIDLQPQEKTADPDQQQRSHLDRRAS